MINFFRKIRRQLANENKFQRYFRYAFGEILLVVIGILIALQVNNWNEKRKQTEQFNGALEKLYTPINTNVEALYTYCEKLLNDLVLLDYLINIDPKYDEPVYTYTSITGYYFQGQSKNLERFDLEKKIIDNIEPYKIPHLIFMLENFVLSANTSNTNYFVSLLNPNPSNFREKDIAKKIINFNNQFKDFSFNNSKAISYFLVNNNIPQPTSVHQSELYFNWDDLFSNRNMYTNQEIDKILNLLKENDLQTHLRNAVSYKFKELRELINIYEEGRNLLSDLRAYNPGLKLNYNIGIIGDAVEGWFANSIPMVNTKPELGIWELDIKLNDGQLKFRNNNSWTLNWGGNKFPKGFSAFYGGNIPVEGGNYHIILNLTENTYEFIKLVD